MKMDREYINSLFEKYIQKIRMKSFNDLYNGLRNID